MAVIPFPLKGAAKRAEILRTIDRHNESKHGEFWISMLKGEGAERLKGKSQLIEGPFKTHEEATARLKRLKAEDSKAYDGTNVVRIHDE